MTSLTATTTRARPRAVAVDLQAGRGRSRTARNAAAATACWICAALALVPLVWVLSSVVSHGYHLLLSADWWWQSQRGITARNVGGGAYHAIVGSLVTAGICAAFSVPLGLVGAIYLVEYGGRSRLARAVSFAVDTLTGLPSIVAALFVYALWISLFGFQRVSFAVALALVLLMVPTVLRASEEMLRLVPPEIRHASYALGIRKWRTILSVVVPAASGGIISGIMLGLARVMGETAPLLILGPYTTSINANPFSGAMAALPTMINQDRTEALQPAVDRTWAAALTLVLLVLALTTLGRAVGGLRGRLRQSREVRR